MLDRALGMLGFSMTEQISDTECSALDTVQLTGKTVMLLPHSNFIWSVIKKLTELPPSYICKIERAEEFEGKLLVVSSDSGQKADEFTVLDAQAACCAALVLRECGAVHSALCDSVRQNGRRIRVFSLNKLVPYTPEGEQKQLRELEQRGGVQCGDLESFREYLAVCINRWEIAGQKASGANELREKLLANDAFTAEWKALEYINAGAYGYIFRAVSALDNGEYALKIMHIGNDMEKLWKAKRESTNASQFYKNNYVVRTFDDGKVIIGAEKYMWISMELLEPIPCEISDERIVARMACDVCLALEEIHKNGGMAHRDVKPANILRAGDHYKLCDFGITKEVQSREKATVIGTSDFMAPELLRAVASNTARASYDNSVDIYALGITMYTLLNRGTAPFLSVPPYIPDAAEQKKANALRIKGTELPKPVNCSDRLMKIIRKACFPDPSQRYSSVSKMYDALENYLED